ncbi:hypothetical protein O6H91_18G000100 [Diphasiastrum complanatum]|uniref:Uncharacterized protein n=1 Tax=Diphasiastrum complanatum TaxID=34168 RepID=A0ACC2AXD9_DIPCM|nr:hypothetical protein O6H91_18G000100 [Diphasiastrum complanatum]
MAAAAGSIITVNVLSSRSTKYSKISSHSFLSGNGSQPFSSCSALSYFSSQCTLRIQNILNDKRSVARTTAIEKGLCFNKDGFTTIKLQCFNKMWSKFESLSMLHGCERETLRPPMEIKGCAMNKDEGPQINQEMDYSSESNIFKNHSNGVVQRGPTKKDSTSESHPIYASQAIGSKQRLGEATLYTTVFFFVLLGALLFVDKYVFWHILQRPPASFHLTRPFVWAAAISGLIGLLFVPFLKWMKTSQVFRKEGPSSHFAKAGTPTLGGLFLVPVGVSVANVLSGFVSQEVWGVSMATLACAAIGLLDDGLSFWRQHNYGLPGRLKLAMQVLVGLWFYFWLDTAHLASPIRMKNVVLLPPPFGPVYIGDCYILLTAFCFAAMSNGVNLTDGLDGLAGGTAAAAFVGMAVAVLPISPGSLALGGALAAMASCTGLFFPLLVASTLFAVETISVILQVLNFKLTKRLFGVGHRLFRMAPFHHHLELLGLKELHIVLGAYILSVFLAVLAAYIGLISV